MLVHLMASWATTVASKFLIDWRSHSRVWCRRRSLCICVGMLGGGEFITSSLTPPPHTPRSKSRDEQRGPTRGFRKVRIYGLRDPLLGSSSCLSQWGHSGVEHTQALCIWRPRVLRELLPLLHPIATEISAYWCVVPPPLLFLKQPQWAGLSAAIGWRKKRSSCSTSPFCLIEF